MSISSSKPKAQSLKVTSSESFDDAKTWDLPTVNADVQNNATNALNKTRTWKYEPPEVEEDIKPLTAADIEAIRVAAYDEGLALGKQEGYDVGLEQGKQEGLEQGISEGKEQGLADGMLAGQEQMDELARSWQSIIDQAANPLAQVNQELEKELVILATKLAKAVINVEVTTQNDVLLSAISEGIKVLPIQESQYQFQMNPIDVAMVKGHFGDEVIVENNWRLIENPAIERGGCELTTQNNAVDMSIGRRSADVFTQFLNAQGLHHDPRNSG
ncbi:MAG: flagellar assembly protein FliH [Gammaproteobacteria bacterium]|jgi:flagellar assembly protein FliH